MSELLDAVRELAKAAAPPWLSMRTSEQRQADNILRDTFGSPGRAEAIVEALEAHICQEKMAKRRLAVLVACLNCAVLRDLAEALGVATGGDP